MLDFSLTARLCDAWRGIDASSLWATLTDGRDGGDNLTQLELVQDGGFTGSIKTDHQDAHLLLTEEIGKQL